MLRTNSSNDKEESSYEENSFKLVCAILQHSNQRRSVFIEYEFVSGNGFMIALVQLFSFRIEKNAFAVAYDFALAWYLSIIA